MREEAKPPAPPWRGTNGKTHVETNLDAADMNVRATIHRASMCGLGRSDS